MNEAVVNESVMNESVINESVMNEVVMNEAVMNEAVMHTSVIDYTMMDYTMMDESINKSMEYSINTKIAYKRRIADMYEQVNDEIELKIAERETKKFILLMDSQDVRFLYLK